MIIIVRHGNTFEAGELPRRIGARSNPPLTRHGQEQAWALGEYFESARMHFAQVLVSPLLRTRQTAELIIASQPSRLRTQQSVLICNFLREVDYGPDEGKPENEVLSRIGTAAMTAWEGQAIVPPGWIVEADQMKAAWRKFFSEELTADRPTLAVTSNGAARFALLADPALCDAATKLGSLKLPTGGFGVIERAADGKLRLNEWGVRL